MMLKRNTLLTGHKSSIFALSPADSDHHFLSGGGEGWIVKWDLRNPDTGSLMAKVETQVFSMCFLPGLNKLVVGNMLGGVHWIDLERPDETINIAHHRKGVFDIAEIGAYVYTAGGQGLLTRWDKYTGRSLESLQLSHQSLRSIAYCPQRHELAVGSSDHAIYILDAAALEVKKSILNAHENSVFSLRYSPNGECLFSGGRDAHLKVWDTQADYLLLSSQPAHLFTINAIAFHPEGQYFATASRDKHIKIWDACSLRLLKVLEPYRDEGHLNSVNDLLWSNYNNQLISGSDDRSVIIWQEK